MRRKHDRIARFDRDQNFEDCGRGGIGRRNNAGNDASRTGDFDDIFVFRNNANGTQVPEIIPDVFRGKPVFFLLVGRDAKTCLFDRQSCDARRLAQRGQGHRFTDMIDLRLVEACQFCLCAMRGFDQVARLLHGN